MVYLVKKKIMRSIWTFYFLVLIYVKYFCHSAVTIRQLGRVIKTRKGQIQGVLVEFPLNRDLYIKPVEAFLGLSYASVSEETRFGPSAVYTGRWQAGVAQQLSKPCPQQIRKARELRRMFPEGVVQLWRRLYQSIRVTSEDCLYLNLYRPTYSSKYPARYMKLKLILLWTWNFIFDLKFILKSY